LNFSWEVDLLDITNLSSLQAPYNPIKTGYLIKGSKSWKKGSRCTDVNWFIRNTEWKNVI